ncbi:conserved hypothetical protein [Kribbella flavida DSM 17836]|uniref:DUF4345 domain-containing protein n=1 Tax=Kribbella flavida (strain DSM 17836 / JCM 10339 / NBRC 14399) TaxID=479435 RepID=D2PQQ9_KRIFD|nr:hypothetical protein [Kribbella flavida]ADB31042.1 conserved hypothetical protein [Kribbella flavida DSM 17836]
MVQIPERVIRVTLLLMGVLTATPALALVDPGQLASYGVSDPDPVVLTLLQHRGIFQLLLGAALVWAAFRADVRVPVAIAAVVSKGGALMLTLFRPDVRAEASAVAMVFDPICIVLLTALLVHVAVRTRPGDRAGMAPA